MSDKKYHNGGNITLNENGEIVFKDDVISALDAIRRHDKHTKGLHSKRGVVATRGHWDMWLMKEQKSDFHWIFS